MNLTEFDLINKLRKYLPKIGDDAAWFSNKELSPNVVISIDSYVEDVDFTRKFFLLEDIGYKACACAVSDIAAMCATPKYILVAGGITNPTEFEGIYKGIYEFAEKYKVEIIGGDITRADKIFITVCALGYGDKLVKRRGAKPGEWICVTGNLGGASAGLDALQAGISSSIILKQLRPEPRLDISEKLKSIATSIIDISDGLVQDLSHILKENNVGAVIYTSKIPLHPELHKISQVTHKDPLYYALYGGEDYELLFTVKNPDLPQDTTVIGKIVEGDSIYDEFGNEIPIKGFDHFA